MKRYILSGVALMFSVTAAIADTVVAPLAAPSVTEPPIFEKVDIDGDGSISIKEAAVIKLTTKQFKMVDLNKDGQLSKAEYEASIAGKAS